MSEVPLVHSRCRARWSEFRQGNDTAGLEAQGSGDTAPCNVTPVILHGVVSGVTLHSKGGSWVNMLPGG